MKKGVYKTAAEYAAYFILLIFMDYTERKLGVRAMSLAFFFALVYNRRNVVILSPLYIAAAILAEPTLHSLLISAVPVAVVLAWLFIAYKASVRTRLGVMAALMALAMLPRAFTETADTAAVLATVIGAVLNEGLFFAFVSLEYLIVRKRFEFPLTAGECVSAAVFLFIIGLGAGFLQVGEIRFYYALAIYAVTLAASAGRAVALFVGVALGAGAAVSGGAEQCAITAIYTLCIALAPREYAYFGGVLGVGLHALCILGGISRSGYMDLVAPAVGAVLGVLTPQKLKEYLHRLALTDSAFVAARTIINRNRTELSNKLAELGASLKETGDILADDGRTEEPLDCDKIARAVSDKCCKSCPNYDKCKDSLRAEGTEGTIAYLVRAAIDSGKASILDAPPYLSARCRSLPALIAASNEIIAGKEGTTARLRGLNEQRQALRGQLNALADILFRLERDAGEPLSYDGKREARIKEALNARLIGVREVYAFGDTVILCVREREGVERSAREAVAAVCGMRMSLAAKEPTVNGLITLTYRPSPAYRVAYGERTEAAGSDGSGDNERVVRLTDDKVMIVLADGMGHDAPANRNSRYAVKLIESFYRAGFDHGTALEAVGNLLALRGREEFNAVDIAVIDTGSGAADIIKQGARESFLVSGGEVEVLECGSLPLGIVAGAEPVTHTVKLTPDTFLVLVSDGVIDTLGREGVIELLAGLDTCNPDDVAEAVIADFRRLSADSAERDDASVIAARIF